MAPISGLPLYQYVAIGESKRFLERWRTLPERGSATLIGSAERDGTAFATVSES